MQIEEDYAGLDENTVFRARGQPTNNWSQLVGAYLVICLPWRIAPSFHADSDVTSALRDCWHTCVYKHIRLLKIFIVKVCTQRLGSLARP